MAEAMMVEGKVIDRIIDTLCADDFVGGVVRAIIIAGTERRNGGTLCENINRIGKT